MANIGIPLLALEPMSYCRVKQYYLWKKENERGQNMSDRKFIDEVVKAHNEYRSRHQASPLSHSKDLSSTAQKWADHLALTNTFQHSNSLKGEKLGENIAMKWSSRPDSYTGQEVTDQWYSEVKMHTFGGEPRSLSSGHFTQVVWKGSKEVGVGKAQTRDGKIIVVANYRPAGNMMGDFARNVLPPKDGKIVIKEKAPDTKPAGFSDGGRHVVTSHDSGGPFKTRFEDMRRDFFKDSSFSSHPSQGSGGFHKSESRSVRTFTVTEGVGPNKVTKKVTEETIIKPDGEKIVNRKEEVTSGGSTSSYGGSSGAMAGDPFRDFDSKLRIGRSPFRGSSPQGKKKGRSKSSSSSDSSQERKPKKPEKMSDFIDGAVKVHNKLRDKHGASKLKHSKELSGHAQKWAEHLASTGTFQHSQCIFNGERIGENIACKWSTGGGDFSSQEVTDQWYSEISKHDYRSERSMATGHFTQVVWKGSKEIGVGKAKGQGGKVIVVAVYRPPGNIIGQYRDNVLPPKK